MQHEIIFVIHISTKFNYDLKWKVYRYFHQHFEQIYTFATIKNFVRTPI